MSDKDTVVSGTQLNWSDVVILMTQPTHKDFLVLFFLRRKFVTFYIARQPNESGSCVSPSQRAISFFSTPLCRDKRAGFMIFQFFFFSKFVV
jgi:hypothetical protein